MQGKNRNNTHIKKQLGQNFLINQGVIEKIVNCGDITEEVGILEIGAGKGALTKELAKYAKKVVAIEIDREYIPLLNETFKDSSNVTILHGDILTLDLENLMKEQFNGLEVVVYGNLPYYITSSIIMKLLESRIAFKSLIVMVQKETAVRFTSKEGSRLTGAVTMAIRYFSEPHYLFDVSPGSFYPKPKVYSALVRFDILKEPSVKPTDEVLMFQVIKAAYMQRRKTAINAITSSLPIDKEELTKIFLELNIDLLIRAEQLTLKDYAAISDSMAQKE